MFCLSVSRVFLSGMQSFSNPICASFFRFGGLAAVWLHIRLFKPASRVRRRCCHTVVVEAPTASKISV
ncbi:hypothetical protein R52603_03767 [Paraburkholderia saeva]|uniref:Uncharacterized protein n=1 Tax=Paraburkholderia saeva TaxID=2777537 RepID=A0A9N8X4I1_9BURK|nr:hypothetical protein R52603_03767 [Paraburkholderia saeva]CAG4925045.1 hypothetical protein LMG31841_05446 [Paraburkholderia saeva]